MMDKDVVKEMLEELVETALESAVNNNNVDIESVRFEADEDDCYVDIFAISENGRLCLDCFNGVTLEGQQMLMEAFEEAKRDLIEWKRMVTADSNCDNCDECNCNIED